MEENRDEFEGQEEVARRLNITWILLLLPVLIISLIMGKQYRQTDTAELLTIYEDFKQDPSFNENNVFLINDAEDYLRFCGYVNRGVDKSDGAIRLNAALMADIDLSDKESFKKQLSDDFKYIKFCMDEYSGVFEGNGHTIKGWGGEPSQVPMFVILNTEGVVRNLHLEDLNIVGTEYSTGGLCKYNYGLIENCSVSGLVQSPLWAGGITGYNSGTIKNCINKAKVISTCETNFFGAGGIAGKNERGKKALERLEEPLITTSSNLGEVEGTALAGGICARNKDAKISSCGNEGTVTVAKLKLTDSNSIEYDALAAGICGDLWRGTIESSYNTGMVSITEPGISDTYGIAGNMFGISNQVLNCVSLEGTAKGSMRHESIMEVTETELSDWKAGKLTYISDNWQFDLEEAKEKFNLSPLEIQESLGSAGKKDAYLCDEFYLRAPEGFEISSPSPYALCIQPSAEKAAALPEVSGYQVWLLRLSDEPEISQFLNQEGLTEKSDTVSKLFWKITRSHYFLPSNLAGFSDQKVEQLINGIFLTKYRDTAVRFYLQEGDRIIDNIISLPLYHSKEAGYQVKWLFLFTDKNSNYRPEDFYQEVLLGFHFPPYVIKVKQGDTLSQLAASYTGDGKRWREFLSINQVRNANYIDIGQELKIPQTWLIGE